MDILIKGMEMPKDCRHCLLKEKIILDGRVMEICKELSDRAVFPFAIERFDGRRNDCPLIALPEHGRCIDADRMLKEQRELSKEVRMLSAVVPTGAIENAPTILEASI